MTDTPIEQEVERALRLLQVEEYDEVSSISNIEGWEDSLDNQEIIKRNGQRPRAANGRFIKA